MRLHFSRHVARCSFDGDLADAEVERDLLCLMRPLTTVRRNLAFAWRQFFVAIDMFV